MSCAIMSGITRVDIVITNNAWWVDAFQFGTLGDTSWSFTNQSFLVDVKAHASDTSPLLALNSSGGAIAVNDAINRILSFNVTDHAVRAALPVTDCDATPPVKPYHYDLIMVDGSTGARVVLMYGSLTVLQGVTVED